jgi:hypothetical protein
MPVIATGLLDLGSPPVFLQTIAPDGNSPLENAAPMCDSGHPGPPFACLKVPDKLIKHIRRPSFQVLASTTLGPYLHAIRD